ncbi:MAG: translation elongation factor Ts [Bacteroidales bacterium]|jgi:elongation factor Ts|nr:translation elongation factor Ts [Bacteroidales bacterium]MDD3665452.1 translation elongation factor Ts [Bacteroidales bacterium]
MANITASEVNKLRQMTGAGMMDCKQALVESDGDFEKAIDYLRKKGQKVANKRADKEANEGIVLASTNDAHTFGIVARINCETDFVAKNAEFVELANTFQAKALQAQIMSKEEALKMDINGRNLEENLTELIGKTGEKMELSGYEAIEAPVVAAYNHMGNRLATLVAFNKTVENGPELAREIAMQVAAMNPVAVDANSVDQATIQRELEIGMEQARAEGKAENMLEKIAQGKLNKFFKDSTLLNQEFIRDSKKTVAQYLTGFDKDLTVKTFRRLQLGE